VVLSLKSKIKDAAENVVTKAQALEEIFRSNRLSYTPIRIENAVKSIYYK
jgi:hypothetical protein